MIGSMRFTFIIDRFIIITVFPFIFIIVIQLTFSTKRVISIILNVLRIFMICFMRFTFTINSFFIITVSPFGFCIVIQLTFSTKRVVSIIFILLWISMISFMGLTLTVAGIMIITESPLCVFIVIGLTFETKTVLSIVLVKLWISVLRISICFMNLTFTINTILNVLRLFVISFMRLTFTFDSFNIITVPPFIIIIIIQPTLNTIGHISIILNVYESPWYVLWSLPSLSIDFWSS